MRLRLVRHGRPDEDDTARPHDPPLRADGRRQAHPVTALLADEAVTPIVTSPMQRARETAEPLAAPDDAHVAVFSHRLPIKVVRSSVLGLERIIHFQPGYGSVTRLGARSPDRIGILSLNETGHHRFDPPT